MQEKIVVLDDDPTGTQTVHGLPVLTEWTVSTLRAEMGSDAPAFYLLTNSRSLGLAEAQHLNREIGRNLIAASTEIGKQFRVISRSDSTLRGHFPGEIEALSDGLGEIPDGVLLIPFFLPAGRYTIDDVHYVAQGERLLPVAETEYARDAVFGYRSSNLRDWVEEKTGGRVPAQDVQSISIDDLRRGGPDQVDQLLQRLHGGMMCVVNAVTTRDLEVFTLGLLRAEQAGKRFLYRTAASFVATRCGLLPRALLIADDFALSGEAGGLVVVGSFVSSTTRQLEVLRSDLDLAAIEVSVDALVDERDCPTEIAHVVLGMNQQLSDGRDVVVFTSRRLLDGGGDHLLAVNRRVSEGLVEIVRQSVRPSYLLAKGGITASDIATKALGVRRALVCGQILPGVPVWRLGPESRFPGLDYIVFPGNVGDENALHRIVEMFKYRRQEAGRI